MAGEVFKSGLVSISGNPNVGKSTLLNYILGQKLAIVSPRPQTTRGVIRGIYNGDNTQIVFVDTPGFLKTRSKLDEFMLKQAKKSLVEADLVYFVVEPQMPDVDLVKSQLNILKKDKIPVFLVINKVDTLPRLQLLPVIDEYKTLYGFNEIIPISAKKGDNVDSLINQTKSYLPEGDPFFDSDSISDQYEKYFVEEMIREKLFFVAHQEIPYCVAVKVAEFNQREDAKWFIRAEIVVEKDSQKAIIIGKNGAMIKKIGQMARKDIELFLDAQCYLELFVKVEKGWRNNDGQLKNLGYVS